MSIRGSCRAPTRSTCARSCAASWRRPASTATVELFLYRPGFEAVGAERLIETVRRCHDQVFAEPPMIVGSPVTSMWRDTNAFNELGIPAISYAPRSASHAARKSFKVKDLTDAAIVYARIAMDLCNQEREPFTPLGAHAKSRRYRRIIDPTGRLMEATWRREPITTRHSA